MRLFSEKVNPIYTKSDVNILTVDEFNEVFYDIYELSINGKKFVAEKVSEYRGAPVVEIPVIVEGEESQVSFVLTKGRFEVLVNKNNLSGRVPVEEGYETARTIKYTDKGNTVEEVVYDRSEGITSEIKTVKEQAERYNENIKFERKISKYVERLRSDLQESIEIAENKIKEYYNSKLELIAERVEGLTSENKQHFIKLISESKKNILKEVSNIKNSTPDLINEEAFSKQNVNLKGIKSEVEKLIGSRFNTEIAALKRLVELSSGGGSVAKQFAEGGIMNGDLTVVGLVSAQNLTITGTISTTMLDAISANIRYLDINTYELSGFHSTGNVDIDGNLTVTGTISATMLEVLSANVTYLDIKRYELSGFDVTGDVDIDGNLTVTGDVNIDSDLVISGVLSSSSYVNDPTGHVIIVDSVTGIDTRSGLSNYDQFKPFKTIEAAVAASTSGDTVYVRTGNYIISSQISLNGKGNVFFETGVAVSISSSITAFSLTTNETKTINGFANFYPSTGSTGILSQSSGKITFDCNNIASLSVGTLFAISGGILDTSFISIECADATIYTLTSSGSLNIRSSHSVICDQFLNANTSGTVTVDVWSVEGRSTQGTITIADADNLSYRGVTLSNDMSASCITFMYSSSGAQGGVFRGVGLNTYGVPILYTTNNNRDVFLDSVKLNALNSFEPSISAVSPVTFYSTTTYSNVLPHPSVTVDGQYNLMSKIF